MIAMNRIVSSKGFPKYAIPSRSYLNGRDFTARAQLSIADKYCSIKH
jgi:hypothetical protein